MRTSASSAAGPAVALWTMIVIGVAIRLVVAATTHGLPFDVGSFEIVRSALSRQPLHLYSLVNSQPSFRWPYPPGFLPLVVGAAGLDHLLGGGFTHIVRVPAIVADVALTWLVWRGLENRLDERRRLLAAGLVMLGPVFVTIAGYATQIDSVAILPAVTALLVWERDDLHGRAWIAGLLVGVAASIKTVPLLMVLALAPSARSWREVVILVGAAVAVPLLLLIPFLAADSSGVLALRHYTGVPGMGGLSLVLQPDLAQAWLTKPTAPSGVETWLFIRHAGIENVFVLGLLSAYLARLRPPPRAAAVLLWLVVLAFGSGFFFQYVVWLLPFLLLAGHLRSAAVLQAAIAVPMVLFYLGPWHAGSIVVVYVAFMLVVWAGWVLGAGLLVRRQTAA